MKIPTSNSYIILMDMGIDSISPYRGAISIYTLKPWYVNGVSPPTFFDSEKQAKGVVDKLMKAYPGHTFDIMLVGVYLALIDSNWRCPWLQELRQEQQPLLKNIDVQ